VARVHQGKREAEDGDEALTNHRTPTRSSNDGGWYTTTLTASSVDHAATASNNPTSAVAPGRERLPQVYHANPPLAAAATSESAANGEAVTSTPNRVDVSTRLD
jgi:hypothetical protein